MKTVLCLAVWLLIINIHLSATLPTFDQTTDYTLRVTAYTDHVNTIPTTERNFVSWIDHFANGDTPTEGTEPRLFARLQEI
jgi:hypothetical protein